MAERKKKMLELKQKKAEESGAENKNDELFVAFQNSKMTYYKYINSILAFVLIKRNLNLQYNIAFTLLLLLV